jgi:hypothetical protein
MDNRARIRTLLRRAGLSAAVIALVPAAAGTATAQAAKKKPTPVITSVSPLNVSIGETLTIRGRHFVRGRSKNTVVFRRSGGRAVFVKAGIGTSRLLKVTLSDKLVPALVTSNGAVVPTRMSIRVLSHRLGKRFTRKSISPIVGPRKPKSDEAIKSDPDGDCDGDKLKNKADTDDDNDLLSDDVEARLTTDPCKGDSDGDGVTDGYEYQSAVDLNDDEYRFPQNIVFAPEKRPYPNPRFADETVDYDGDGLPLGKEFALWSAYRNVAAGLNDLVYSDGNQYSAYGRDASGNRPGPLVGANPEAKYSAFIAWAQANGYWDIKVPIHSSLVDVQLNDFDFDGDTSGAGESRWYDLMPTTALSDDERDEDADGLTNYDEYNGRMSAGYWAACYSKDKVYPVKYAGTDLVDPDSDGDGVRDGADDQDHDDLPNLMELSRSAASQIAPQGCGAKIPVVHAPVRLGGTAPDGGMVNPFNPCLPYTDSRTCSRHPLFSELPAPFDGDTPIYWVLN